MFYPLKCQSLGVQSLGTHSRNNTKRNFNIIISFLVEWFWIASDLWTVAISFYLFITLALNMDPWTRWWFNDFMFAAVVLAPSGAVAVLPLLGIGGGYSFAGAWCWYRLCIVGFFLKTQRIDEPLYRLLLGFSFHWVAVFLLCLFFVAAFVYFFRMTRTVRLVGAPIHALKSSKSKRARLAVFKRLAPFPIVRALILIPGTINRIQNLIDPDVCFIIYSL